MDARICTNPQCRTIFPSYTCSLCTSPTEQLPPISLAPIGLDGQARLTHTSDSAYRILVTLPSGNHTIKVSLSDLLHALQPHLPHPAAVTGLMVMDALHNAATLIRTRNTGHWAQWVLSLLEVLQDHTDPTSFQDMLKDLQQDLRPLILESADPPEAP